MKGRKKMKKISALVLAIVLVCTMLSLASCKELTAYQVFHEAMEKTEALDSFECKANIDMAMKFGGMEITVPMSYNFKAAGLKGDKPEFSGTTQLDMGIIKVDASVYNSGEYAYVDMSGTKLKMKLSSEEGSQYDFTKIDDEIVADLPEEALKDVQLVENEDGTKSIDVTLTAEEFNKYCKGMLDSVKGNENLENATDITVEDIKLKVVISKDGYISKYSMSFKMNMKVDLGELGGVTETSVAVDADIEYVNPGQTVTVTAPADLDSYAEGLDSGLFD